MHRSGNTHSSNTPHAKTDLTVVAMTLGTTQGEEVILDTNWYEEGRQLPSVCLMTRSASSAQWSFSSWHLARFLVSKDTDGKTRLTIVTDVSLQHRSLSTDAQTHRLDPDHSRGPVSVRACRTTPCESSG